MKIKFLFFFCVIAALYTRSFAQMKYNKYLPFYDSLGVPTYMSLKDTTKYFSPLKIKLGAKIVMVNDHEELTGYYVLESKRKWVFRKQSDSLHVLLP